MEIEKKYRKFFQIAILLFSFFSFSQTTYYVSKSGSNTNNGTSTGTPFLTISHAISQISAGDIIYIRSTIRVSLFPPLPVGVSVVRPAHRASAHILDHLQEWTPSPGGVGDEDEQLARLDLLPTLMVQT